MPKKTATLSYIAKQLGIHVSTVSRVLNGDPAVSDGAASKATITRIREFAAEVGYVRNPHATVLKTRRSHEIAVLVPRLSDIVPATVYENIDMTASRYGYTVSVSNTFDDADRQRQQGELALRRSVDGLIIGDSHITTDPGWVEQLEARGVPYILVTRRRGQHVSVTSNDYLGGRMAAEHLWQQGHRQVALLGGDQRSSPGFDRTRGFVDYFAECGVNIEEERILTGLFDASTGRRQGEQLLAFSLPITAVFAVNDFLAVGLCGALSAAGINPGVDVAVVGYNDTELAAQLSPALTSISTTVEQQGQLAVELLLKLIDGVPVESRLLDPVLHVRASSSKDFN